MESANRQQRRELRVQQKRLEKLEDRERRLLEPQEPSLAARKVSELAAPVRERLGGKSRAVEKSAELLERAFERSFDLVLEKGSGLIGRMCGERRKLERYEAFAKKPLSGWELTRLGCEAAMGASANLVFSTVQGGAMGALGIGLPDVPIFLGAVLKTLFEISLRFGFPYHLPQEQVYQLLLIGAAVGPEQERRCAAADADRTAQEIRMGGTLSISREEAKRRAAHALCSAALAGKLVQGTPIIGVYGGFQNGVLLRKIGSMAAVKYQQRLLRERQPFGPF